MLFKDKYLTQKALYESLERPIYYPMTHKYEEKIMFLKTVIKMPYSYEWFAQKPNRLNAMYNKAYGKYLTQFIKDFEVYAKTEREYELYKQKYESELENEKEMEMVYKC